MSHRPIILVTPSTEQNGAEFSDYSISLSNRYTDAVIAAGGLPQVLPATTSKAVIEEAVRRCDGVIITGGDDIDPKLYAPDLPETLAKKVGPPDRDRDIWEKDVIDAVFTQRKPLFGICRGHQMLNVVLGGTLLADIPSQRPDALNHGRMDLPTGAVHDVTIAPDSLLGRITGMRTLGVNSTHHQAIGAVAPPLRVVAATADGIIEAVELKEPARHPFLLAVQFHPERLIDGNGVFLQLFRSFIEACAQGRKSL
jgi:putative glutamine amidotransferase